MSPPAPTAQRLRRFTPRILQTWEERTRQKVPAARAEASPALRDSLPDMLAELATTLEHPSPVRALVEKEHALGREHGHERATLSSYSLEQVIHEYQLLRQVLFEVLEEEGPLSTVERDVLLDAVQVGVRNAVSEFSRQRGQEAEDSRKALQEAHALLDQQVQERTMALALSEERFRLFVEGVHDYALFTLDPEGVITSWNFGCVRVKGYTVREAVGHHFRMLYTEEGQTRRDAEEHLIIAAREGRFRGEGMRRRKDGSTFLADVLITPMYRDGLLIGFSKVVQDLTERSLLVRERDLSRSTVENFRVEREVRERFIAMVSHDLRTPLTAAKMSAQIILRRPEAHERHLEYAARVLTNLERLDRMVTDLLDASRLREGRALTVELSHFDLPSLAQEVAEELATVHGDRFLVHSDGKVEGYWSRDGLRRVLENLAVNAVKYGEQGSPITFSVHRSEHRAGLRVLNLGKGLTPEEQEGLFGHFHRGVEAERGAQPGWGVGLTVVRGVVEALGGTVGVTSTPNSGTTFFVDLPLDSRPFAKEHSAREQD
ncbi:PAS domain-containing sensor histidine kinase [Corallococcus sp. CA053C]|uniref:sensor histidine kinase n=1 Tax=Corallococcus sp. CA053C TaxID=2316732 RepID=UPI0011C41051|nr:PAS domain-containing sensor histidine kinase [Corallococcus sp. CA053C]